KGPSLVPWFQGADVALSHLRSPAKIDGQLSSRATGGGFAPVRELPPDRPSEIDLVRTGERTSSGANRAADQRAFKGGAPTSAPPTTPTPAPMAPPLKARSPVLWPQALSAR